MAISWTAVSSIMRPDTYSGNVATFNNVDLSGSPVVALITAADPVTPLPVTWEGFTASVKGQDVTLDWKVSNIIGANSYQVEYAENGKGFYVDWHGEQPTQCH